jgi:multidrug efflux system membrane fusion protein
MPMDGDQMVDLHREALIAEPVERVAARPHLARWLGIVGLLLALVVGGLVGFNWYRQQAIRAFFAANKPPPVQVSAVAAKSEAVPRLATGIGSLAAVHQVTITPELGGRVTGIFFEAGQRVPQGERLVQLNDAPERGDLANYQAQARMAQISLTRSQSLRQHQFAAQETVDQNQSQLEQAQGQIAKTEAIIAQKLIRAPFAGQLGLRQVDLGQYLSPGAPIATLTDLSTLYVNLTLPATQRAQIVVGQRVEVTADAFPGRVFTAQVTAIEPQVNADTRTLHVQATMANPDNALLPGMFVNGAVVLPTGPDTVVLPETAVEYTLYGDSVYVVREDGKDQSGQPSLKVVRQPVKTGDHWSDKVAILEGIAPGERVVAAGQIKLQDGARVVVTGAPPPQPPADPTLH